MKYLKAELVVIKNIATAAVFNTAPKPNEVSSQKHNGKNTNVEGGTDTKNGRNDKLDIPTQDLMELDTTDTIKNHESMPVLDKDRANTAPIYLEFSE
jgi:hypothetical protein